MNLAMTSPFGSASSIVRKRDVRGTCASMLLQSESLAAPTMLEFP